MSRYDIAIVGAGMAGASLAAALAPHASVLLIEGEDQPGNHATGRSAAFWTESYGGPGVQPLTAASGPLLAAAGVLRERGALHIADRGGAAALAAFEAAFSGTIALDRLERGALAARIPGLRGGWDAAIAEPGTTDIDVGALHAQALAEARRHGVALRCAAPLRAADRRRDGWTLTIGDEAVVASILVDAAGAWADPVAALAGARPLGLQPYRRTMVQLRVDPPVPEELPLVLDAAGRFYFKPEHGRLWLSPHDETPVAPGDAAPEEIDVALAIARLGEVVDWRVEAVERRWAGLRTFAPDRLPVYGFDARVPGFFWFAGQGGFGIQTASAAALIGAALLLGHALPDAVSRIDAAGYAPTRFG